MASYDRFWELHLTGTNGFYDFAASIRDQRNYQLTQHKDQLKSGLLLVTPDTLVKPGIITGVAIPETGLPAQGYVATCVTIQDLTTQEISPLHQTVIAWVNDPLHTGKLRLNAHGDGMGHIGMADGTGADFPVHYKDADKLVDWLIAGGLSPVDTKQGKSTAGKKNINGLITINLAICMGARYGTSPAKLDWFAANSTPATGSAAHKVAVALGAAKLTGIEVTASNEITMDGASGKAGVWGRTFGLGGNQTPTLYPLVGLSESWNIVKKGQGVQIDVPTGWSVTAGGIFTEASISPPSGFTTWVAAGTTPSAGWTVTNGSGARIEVPPGWIVKNTEGKILPPLGFDAISKGTGLGGTLSSKEDASPFTGMGQRMAHSMTKTRAIA